MATGDHLPTRPLHPAPSAPPADLARNARRAGLEVPVISVGGQCAMCGTAESSRWTEVAIDGYGHRHGDTSALVVGWCCRVCLPDAIDRAERTRQAAARTSSPGWRP